MSYNLRRFFNIGFFSDMGRDVKVEVLEDSSRTRLSAAVGLLTDGAGGLQTSGNTSGLHGELQTSSQN